MICDQRDFLYGGRLEQTGVEITKVRQSFPALSIALTAIVLFGQRIAITISGIQLGIGFVAFFLFIVLGVLNHQIVILKNRLFFYGFSVTGLLITALIASYTSPFFSAQSLLLLCLLYSLSIFALSGDLRPVILSRFQGVVFIFAIIGIMQFLTQLLGITYRDWLSFIPKQNIIANYNYTIPIEYGSHLFKSNGIFCQEPSAFSQLMAVAILLELYLFRQYARLIVWIGALLVSFSGTGLALLAVGLIPMIFGLNIKTVVIFLGVGAIAMTAFLYSGFASYTLNRVAEFSSPNKSAHIRFVSPYVSYVEFLEDSDGIADKVMGLGPGASERYSWDLRVHFTPFMKLLLEYGVFGIVFFVYLVYIFFSRQPFWLAFALFVLYAFLSGGLLTPQTIVLYYLLLTLHPYHGVTMQPEHQGRIVL